jgi:hypothetical protein
MSCGIFYFLVSYFKSLKTVLGLYGILILPEFCIGMDLGGTRREATRNPKGMYGLKIKQRALKCDEENYIVKASLG